MWVRGLKQTHMSRETSCIMSHPMWVRGLKLVRVLLDGSVRHVAPYVGAWIETWQGKPQKHQQEVAPYVGAWIETTCLLNTLNITESHPMWVRGLKRWGGSLPCQSLKSHPMWVRGLKRFITDVSKWACVAPYVGAWIETYAFSKLPESLQGRTLCGCVD